ncbi:bifunctional metallophosphatase/5'-nucleotidase [Pseudalkalibacillus caeni]|uniref:Bifunctional metallophosphatase/5'-nucleotidase n=1 Tax=Exobacillus caeni TaxID=2574798 RepID=A0A5R9F0S9_9BACL|nr:5'-nucleotidase C-terminal domain-containing protein [Pseudalkalibacillus caeni]TLS35038.1 bifunctional metallophosphatase/5'-nucleotidase [Pseudalkalibacillus caeni]
MRLKLIHSNDIHSNFDNFSKAVTLIKEHKDENTIVMDAGDFADFKSIELQGTKGIAAVELLETAGYDVLTIGNNETFNGIDTLEHMATNSRVPFISNNILTSDQRNIHGVNKSIILIKSGIRILITGASPDLGEFNDLMGYSIHDYKTAILEEIASHEGEYDICIVLNHVGTFADEPFAEETDKIDVIISSHDHKLYTEAKVINGTIINSAGMYGQHIGIIEVELKDGSVELIKSSTHSTAEAKPDYEIMEILQKNKEKAIENLSKPLYQIERPLWHDVMEENPLSNLIADGLKDMFPCDIGIINSGITNGGIVNFLSDKKLIEICPSPLNPTYMEIQGKHLKTAIERSLDAQVCLEDGKGPGFRGKYVGRLHVSGVDIIHDGRRVKEILIGGQALDDERWYSVSTSDYLQRGTGYPSLANNQNIKYRPEEIKDVIRQYANQQSFLERAFVNRWVESVKV